MVVEKAVVMFREVLHESAQPRVQLMTKVVARGHPFLACLPMLTAACRQTLSVTLRLLLCSVCFGDCFAEGLLGLDVWLTGTTSNPPTSSLAS